MLIQNIEKLQKYLQPIALTGIKNIIDGKVIDAVDGATFDNHTPIDGSFVCKVAKSSAADVDAAAQAAHAAFQTWRKMPHAKRKSILVAIADKIEEHAEEIALLESYDTGQCIKFMQKAAIRGAENFRYFADKIIDAPNGLSTPDTEHINFTVRQPIGAVGIITPWNTPFMLSTWKIAPALASGCTVVHKPAELSPVTAFRLAQLAHEAGLPKGVWNVINGFGETAGKALTEHPLIKAIAFIGETTTGSHIMRQGAPTLKRVHLELGGQNPILVFADANLERALDATIFMKYSLNGERCTSSSRLILQDTIYDSFVEKLTERVKKIKVGHPLDPSSEIGPMIHTSHQTKVLSYQNIGVNEGAKLMTELGTPPDLPVSGAYVMPTLFVDATPDMRIAQEEVFGPFLTVLKFTTEQEAIDIANSVQYGLAAYIWTNDIGRSQRLALEVEAGMVWINSENVRHLPTPFGGVKNSGIGRDGGEYSFDFYMETKNIAIALGNHVITKLGK